MRKLLNLIEAARKQGHLKWANRETGNRDDIPLTVLDHFLEHCEPLVFSPTNGPVDEWADGAVTKINENLDPIIDNAPFKIFSVEFTGDTAVSAYNPNDPEDIPHTMPCLIAIEIEPMVFQFIIHLVFPDAPDVVWYCTDGYEPILQQMLARLNREKVGTVGTGRQRVRRLDKKGKHTFKRIIYCQPKQTRTLQLFGGERTIDYSHRFLVRGHWRKLKNIETLGKDRTGRYCIEGYTWVNPFEKGGEDKVLIKNKVRVVK